MTGYALLPQNISLNAKLYIFLAMAIIPLLSDQLYVSYIKVLIGEDPDDSVLLTLELHVARDGRQECREVCGAHGYFKRRNILVN